MGDIVGRLFREFAVTLSVTILVSAVVSLTLTPMMCAKILKHKPESEQGRFYRASEHAFNSDHRLLRHGPLVGAAAPDAYLARGRGNAGRHRDSLHYDSQGIFPDPGHGRHSGSLGSRANHFLPGDVGAAAGPGEDDSEGSGGGSLSSFIGIDGTNTTMNSGRILINLKPLEERNISASDVIRRLQPEIAQVAGITLYMQPVQDLTVEDRVSRTQFQYTLEDPNADELNAFVPKMVDDLKQLPELRDVARISRRRACGRSWCSIATRRRAWASRRR